MTSTSETVNTRCDKSTEMRTLKEVMMEIWNYSHPEEEPEYEVLRKYIEEVIDECGDAAYEARLENQIISEIEKVKQRI